MEGDDSAILKQFQSDVIAPKRQRSRGRFSPPSRGACSSKRTILCRSELYCKD